MSGELIITPLPGRKGIYLCLDSEAVCLPVARFISEGSLRDFRDWANAHPLFSYVDERPAGGAS